MDAFLASSRGGDFQALLVLALTTKNNKITEFGVIADPDRLHLLDPAVLDL
ncbi:hypothetical protein [Spirillospora sp. CA-294931]|uniref:hypothetical protein n=1 Tax=Spirillospora sp. CA-294931 TaxID=3240042 RepID=UPI003D8A8A51